MIPNTMQIAHMGQPQVIGTLIQPQAATIQCVNGMMSTEQMMLGAQPQLEMITDPTSGCMYLTQAQPQVYYGLETIVQNTVMSSQQFVSTAMQGVLSQNSSFSATTTQVFQSSKIEPIMEVPAGYVVLNNMSGDNNMNVLATTTTTTQQQQQQQAQQPQQQSIMPQFDGTYTIGKPQQQQQATMGSPQIIQSYAPSPQQQQQQQQIQQLQQQQQQIQQQINETSAQLMSSPPFILTTGQAGGAGKVQTQLVNKVQPQTLTTVPTQQNAAPAVVNQIQITPTQASEQPMTAQQAPVLQLQNVIDQMNKQPQSILPKNVTIISNQTVSEPSYRLSNATPKMTNIIRPIKNEKIVNAVAVKPKVMGKMNKMAVKLNQAPVMQQQQIQLLQTSATVQAPPQTIVEPIVIKPQQQQQQQQQQQPQVQSKMNAGGVTMAKVQMVSEC
jgi:[histone H3]-lysine4 N-trimethyltransferase MLL1